MAAGSIVIDLLMKTGSFETDTKRAEARLRALEKEARQVGVAIGTAFTAAAAATALLVKASIDAADEAIKTAQSVGLTVEAYSSLAFAADLSGVSQEQLAKALVKLSSKASDAAGGLASASVGFDKLGISVKNTDGSLKDSDKLLTEIAGKFAGFADSSEKSALAAELFGDKIGPKLIPLLNGGAAGIAALRTEAAALGLVLDTQTARAAEQFNDDLTRLGGVVRGFGNVLAREALPALNDVNALLLDLAKNEDVMSAATSAAQSVLGGLLNVFQAIAVVVSDVIFVFKGVGREIGAIAAQIGTVLDVLTAAPGQILSTAKSAFSRFSAISDAVKQDGATARAELDAFQRRLMEVGNAGRTAMAGALGGNSGLLAAPALPKAPGLGGGGSGGAGKASGVSEADRYLANLQRQFQATKDLSVEERLLEDIQAGRLGKVNAAQEKVLRAAAAQIDNARRQQSQMQAEREQEKWFREDQAATERELAQIYEQTRTPLEKLNIELARLNKLRAVAGANQDALARAEFDAWEKYEGAVKKGGEALDDFAKNAAQNIQGFLGSALADAMEGNFKDIGRNFTRMVNRLVAEAIAADLTRRLFGSAGGSGGGSGGDGWIGQAISAAGSYFGFGGAKAGGGDVMPGREYWVGENGPERFRPRGMGAIVPAGATAGGARQLNQTLNISVQGAVSAKTATQIGAEAGRALRRADRMNG